MKLEQCVQQKFLREHKLRATQVLAILEADDIEVVMAPIEANLEMQAEIAYIDRLLQEVR